jgi:hypothetical protein
MLLSAALVLAMYLKEVHPAALPVAPPPCIAPTLDDARAHLPVAVKATLTARKADGTLVADQILEQGACRQKLNMIMQGSRPDFERLRALFEEAIRTSQDGHIFVVKVTLSGTLSEAERATQPDGPADVSLNVDAISDARIIEVFLTN